MRDTAVLLQEMVNTQMAFHCKALESLATMAASLRQVDGHRAAEDLRARLLDPEPLVEGPGLTYDSKTAVGPQTADEVLVGGVRSGMASQDQASALIRSVKSPGVGDGEGAAIAGGTDREHGYPS